MSDINWTRGTTTYTVVSGRVYFIAMNGDGFHVYAQAINPRTGLGVGMPSLLASHATAGEAKRSAEAAIGRMSV